MCYINGFQLGTITPPGTLGQVWKHFWFTLASSGDVADSCNAQHSVPQESIHNVSSALLRNRLLNTTIS